MKKLLFTLVWALLCILSGCTKTESVQGQGVRIEDSQQELVFAYYGGLRRIVFTAYENWTLEVPADASDWCHVAESQGGAGNFESLLTIRENSTDFERMTTVVLTAGEMRKEIKINQHPNYILQVEKERYVVPVTGGEIEIKVTSNLNYRITIQKMYQDWIEQIDVSQSSASRATETKVLRFRIRDYSSGDRRMGKITFASGNIYVDITVIQGTAYESEDYSMDGRTHVRSLASDGEGINLVFMGDAFSDRQIQSGRYNEVIEKGVEAFFSEEPYKSFRHLFNVYSVDVVSPNEEYYTGAVTALSGFFGNGTLVGGNDQLCKDYALKVPGLEPDDLENTLIVVMMNRQYYAGTCYMYYPSSKKDYGMGFSIAYFPLGTDEDVFDQLVCHEAGGHGFAKLADEYSYVYNGTVPSTIKEDAKATSDDYGWYKNIDFTRKPEEVKWSQFISDDRYAKERVGVFEGAYTYVKGAYRPTFESIMVHNVGGFNAPSREAIYYRIHKLAYGADWTYDYEAFVKYDMKNLEEYTQRLIRKGVYRELEPLHPPVVRKVMP